MLPVSLLRATSGGRAAFLAKDMQARFSQNFGTAGEFRASACWAAARETPGREAVGDALDRKRWNRSGDLDSGGWTAVGRTSRVCEKNAEDAAPCDRFGA